jgi:hypothetical protein
MASSSEANTLEKRVQATPIEALPGEIEGKSSAFGPAMVIASSSGKTDDAPEQEWFQYWNADLALRSDRG